MIDGELRFAKKRHRAPGHAGHHPIYALVTRLSAAIDLPIEAEHATIHAFHGSGYPVRVEAPNNASSSAEVSRRRDARRRCHEQQQAERKADESAARRQETHAARL
jgi:hypothetical protein